MHKKHIFIILKFYKLLLQFIILQYVYFNKYRKSSSKCIFINKLLYYFCFIRIEYAFCLLFIEHRFCFFIPKRVCLFCKRSVARTSRSLSVRAGYLIPGFLRKRICIVTFRRYSFHTFCKYCRVCAKRSCIGSVL